MVGVARGLIKHGKHKTGREGTCAGTGSAMALAASDGSQDCCSRVSMALRVTYNHIGIVQAHGMTKLGVAGRSRAKHSVGEVINQNYFDTNLVSFDPVALTTYKSNA